MTKIEDYGEITEGLFKRAQSILQRDGSLDPCLFLINFVGGMYKVEITEIGVELSFEEVSSLIKASAAKAEALVLIGDLQMKWIDAKDLPKSTHRNMPIEISENDPESYRALTMVLHIPGKTIFREMIYIKNGGYSFCDQGWEVADANEKGIFANPYVVESKPV